MNSTEKNIPIVIENVVENEEIIENTQKGDGEESENEEVMSVTRNISKVRLTLEEIIANDNEASRQQYLPSPKLDETVSGSVADDGSSVSSRFESDRGSIISTSSSGIKSLNDAVSIKLFDNDAFRGIDDDDFSNLDRYGFLRSSSKSLSMTNISEKEFMEKERLRL